MARIRTIKPSFWSDAKVCMLRRDARLLAIGLISFADDQGRFLASPGAIIGYVFPNDSVTHKQLMVWRDEIEAVGLIGIYKVRNFEYGHFPRWTHHQRISHPAPSTFPPPSGEIQEPRQSEDGVTAE